MLGCQAGAARYLGNQFDERLACEFNGNEISCPMNPASAKGAVRCKGDLGKAEFAVFEKKRCELTE